MATSGKSVWIGRALALPVTALFAMSAFMKLRGGAEVAQGLAHLGLPEALIIPLAILESVCLAAYVVPATSVLGAILLTGYLGGAICTHWRVGDPLATPIVLGVVIWLSLYLREDRLKALIPLRRPSGR